MNPFKIVGWVGMAIAIVGAFVEIPYAGLLLVLLGLVGVGAALAGCDTGLPAKPTVLPSPVVTSTTSSFWTKKRGAWRRTMIGILVRTELCSMPNCVAVVTARAVARQVVSESG